MGKEFIFLLFTANVRNNDGHGFCRGWQMLHLLPAAFNVFNFFIFRRNFFLITRYNVFLKILKKPRIFFV
jgi:hypothetical protein